MKDYKYLIIGALLIISFLIGKNQGEKKAGELYEKKIYEKEIVAKLKTKIDNLEEANKIIIKSIGESATERIKENVEKQSKIFKLIEDMRERQMSQEEILKRVVNLL